MARFPSFSLFPAASCFIIVIIFLLSVAPTESAPTGSKCGLSMAAQSILSSATPLGSSGSTPAVSSGATPTGVANPEASPTVAANSSGSGGSVSGAPYFVVYSDQWVSGETGPPNVTEITGYNVFALSFLLADGSADQAQEWQSLTSDQRSSIKAEYAAAGIALVVSAFGSTETPTSSGYDPIDTANTMAAWVLEYDLDGIDVDYEDFNAFDAGTGAAEQWLGNFTTQLRTQLPQGQYILTHAPVAPWFSPSMWGGGGYLWVDQQVGDLIDWYNIQFYNQGTTEYTTCDGLLYNSSSTWPQSALFQISASGVSLDQLVIGKPATSADANNGYMDTSTLASCVSEAASAGWNAGVMVWEFPGATSSWIEAVRGTTYPVS